MLHSIKSTDPRFKAIQFQSGFNIIVAEKTKESSETDSRNGAGKSSIIEIIHFLLGMNSLTKSVLCNGALKEMSYSLELDWPGFSGPLKVYRSIRKKSKIEITGSRLAQDLVEATHVLSVRDWVDQIGEELFGLSDDHEGLYPRRLLAYLVRQDSRDGFIDAVKTYPGQPVAESSAHVAYLLGLDWRLATAYQKLTEQDTLRKKIGEATKDPSFSLVVGSVSELRGLVASNTQVVNELEVQVRAFRVVPEYESLQDKADAVDEQIRSSRTRDFADRRNLIDLEAALRDEKGPEINYLERSYRELGIHLPELIHRRYEEVKVFHDSVIANRKVYLEEELLATRARLAAREKERLALGEEQARLLRLLESGGALRSLSIIQEQLSNARAKLQNLKLRFEAAKSLEATQAEIKFERSAVRNHLTRDLAEREHTLEEIDLLFQKFASSLYGDNRDAFIEISAQEKSLKVMPYIGGEDSQGIGNMVTFCFDLVLAVLAHRSGKGPDFLVHDSRLFDGVDGRQISRAFQLVQEVAIEENLQYIVTINSDDLEKANGQGPNQDQFIVEPHLTDAYDDGGLFGFHFE